MCASKVETGLTTATLAMVCHLEDIQDSNETQTFDLTNSAPAARYLKLTFNQFSDFYGRTIIYSLHVYGAEAEEAI